MIEKTRVVITGYAGVHCLHGDASLARLMSEAGADAALTPESNARPLSVIDSAFADDKITRRMDRFSLMAYVAVRQALEHAGVDIAALQPERIGMVMNTCYGPLDSTRRYISKLIRDGARKVPAAVFPNTVHNAFAGLITMEIGIHGTNSTVSGQNPICYGLDMIREGRDDMMIVGGCDELLAVMTQGFASAGLGPASAPAAAAGSVYDRDGGSFRLGEGAAVLVIESEASARARGAQPLAEILDYGMANGLDGTPGAAFPADEAGLRVAMTQALQRSGLQAGQVDFIAGASNGLARLARVESDAIAALFGVGSAPLVSSVKSALGETLGAATALSTVFALDTIADASVAPIWSLAPGAMPPHYVAGSAVAADIEVALVNNIELGGTITSLALRRYRPVHAAGAEVTA